MDALLEGIRLVSAPDVQGVYAWWLGDDVSRVWRVASRYQLSDEEAVMLYGSAVRRNGSQAPGAGRKQHAVVEVWTEERFELWLDGAPLEAARRVARTRAESTG